MVKTMQVEDRKGQCLVTITCNEVEDIGNPLWLGFGVRKEDSTFLCVGEGGGVTWDLLGKRGM